MMKEKDEEGKNSSSKHSKFDKKLREKKIRKLKKELTIRAEKKGLGKKSKNAYVWSVIRRVLGKRFHKS